jgi:hypothetical protein
LRAACRIHALGVDADIARVRGSRLNRHLGRNTAVVAVTLAFALLFARAATAEPIPSPTRLVYAPGAIVAIPAAIPHEEGDMVDRRILPDLRWIAARFPIFVTDGYSGPLPDGEHVGCNDCHVKGSDHYNGLAVDIVPQEPSSRCDSHWTAITRLAQWAEPVQNKPRPPFRWVGYEGDAGHGCGNHLHLSWNHALAPQFQLAEWVEVFPAGKPATSAREPSPPHKAKPPTPSGPPGGIGQSRTGGFSAAGAGD